MDTKTPAERIDSLMGLDRIDIELRIISCARRLARLIELNAPDIIILNEMRMLEERNTAFRRKFGDSNG